MSTRQQRAEEELWMKEGVSGVPRSLARWGRWRKKSPLRSIVLHIALDDFNNYHDAGFLCFLHSVQSNQEVIGLVMLNDDYET